MRVFVSILLIESFIIRGYSRAPQICFFSDVALHKVNCYLLMHHTFLRLVMEYLLVKNKSSLVKVFVRKRRNDKINSFFQNWRKPEVNFSFFFISAEPQTVTKDTMEYEGGGAKDEGKVGITRRLHVHAYVHVGSFKIRSKEMRRKDNEFYLIQKLKTTKQ